MGTARSLREIFGELAGAGDRAGTDPADLLARAGHPGLPEELVAQAVAGFAETARPEIAEHLAPYVMAHSPIPGPDGDSGEALTPWLDLLVTAPPLDPVGLDFDFGSGADVDRTPAVDDVEPDWLDDLVTEPDPHDLAEPDPTWSVPAGPDGFDTDEPEDPGDGPDPEDLFG
ncbi:hypothetical protein [Actinoplanes regularis]|uniref:hypothetical protein n=1 Tax=Actinoplanes regularis TaxID=52697 RepID=UPI0024A0EDC5|nr:hypothetical protein [Actinoplanes regularis]GLW30381.1 hypothetical protein Areg01_33210 [Actinoplanes regularis]